MFFFKKRNKADKTKENSDLIRQNDKRIEELIVLAGNNALIDELRGIQEKIRYLIPSADDKVAECDRKIKEQIEDLKIRMVKEENSEQIQKTVEHSIKQLNLLIAERNAKI